MWGCRAHCHIALVRLEWPVKPETLPVDYYRLPSPGEIGTRVFEEAVFMDKVFPPAHDVEFLDLNIGISWHLGWKNGSSVEDFAHLIEKSPWTPRPMTMISKSILLMRLRGQHIRILDGWEHMQLIGWDHRIWDESVDKPAHETMVSLSGNAFSGFAVHPVMMIGVALSGMAKFPDPFVVADEADLNADNVLKDLAISSLPTLVALSSDFVQKT